MPHPSTLLICLLVPWLAWGCAARAVSRQRTADIARADALVRQGCYRCLEEAFGLYERASVSSRHVGAASKGAFEAALLLAVRAREIGLPSEAWLERARALGSKVRPSNVPSPVDPAVLVMTAELVMGELSGVDPEERLLRTQRVREELRADPTRRVAVHAAAGDAIVAAYLTLAIECESAPLKKPADAAALVVRHGSPPLLQFRAAMCGLAGAQPMETLRARDSRWLDTLFFEGRREIQSRAGDPDKAVALLTEARDAFPASDALPLTLARAQRAVGDYASALAGVDSVLAKLPTHRDALLARVENLSALQRHEEAAATATTIIDLGTWHLGDAYYWRAWNQFYLRRLDPAWADVERALTLQSNTSVYTLAGFIAHARKELEVAVDRFARAFAMDGTNCIAAFSGGMVQVERQIWPPASTSFSQAMSCYTSDAGAARAELARIEASTSYRPDRKARLATTAQKRIDSSEHLAAQSAFNAAQCYLRQGQKDRALTHVDAAAAHALLRDKAASLKLLIEKMR